MMSDMPYKVGLQASWQPSERDQKLLKRHLVRKQLRSFFPSTGRNMGVTAFFAIRAKYLQQITGVPELVWVCGWPSIVILAYLISSWLQVRRDTVAQSYLRSVTMRPDTLTVLGKDVWECPLAQILSLKRTTDGIFIDRLAGCLFVPIRAFEGEAGAIAFEDAYRQARDTANDIRVPPRPDAHDFPISILVQQAWQDVVHAYYHGWRQAFRTSGDGLELLLVLLGPTLFCLAAAVCLQFQLADCLYAALAITLVLGFAAIIYRLSPLYPLKVAQSRHPLKQPLRVGLGPSGITVHDGKSPCVFGWEIVQKLGDDNQLIYVQLSGDLILIPKSSFLDDSHAAEFLEAAKAYGRGETPPIDQDRAVWPPAPSEVA